jgi:hypothetical protein
VEEPRDPGRYVLRDRYRAGGRRRGAPSADDAARNAREPVSGLVPLHWRAEEDLIYEAGTETLHRPGCPRIVSPETVRPLPTGAALARVMAPRICECRPDVTTMLSYWRPRAEDSGDEHR